MATLMAVIAVSGATALGKSRGGVDRSFGSGGTLDLQFAIGDGQYVSFQRVVAGPDRSLYLLNRESRCSGLECEFPIRITRLRPNGAPMTSYGNGGSVRLHSARRQGGVAMAVDGFGRLVFAVVGGQQVAVFRLTAGGEVDASFGRNGTVGLPCDCGFSQPEIGFDRGGRIGIGLGYRNYRNEGKSKESRIWAARLTPRGTRDPHFGRRGLVDSRVPGIAPQSTIRKDGSIVFGGRLEGPKGIFMTRIAPDGKIDRRYARRFRRSLRALRLGSDKPVEASSLVRGPHGSISLVGSNQYYEGFALRLRRGGALDRKFSGNGYKRLRSQVSIAVGSRGKLVLVANAKQDGIEISVLDYRGRRDRSYGNRRHLILSSWWRLTDLVMQGRRPLLFDDGGQECRGYCPPNPKLLRMRALR